VNQFLNIKEYLFGIESIDAQHAKLLEMINLLVASMADGDSRPVLESLIEKLYAFAQSHFAHEEELMEQAGFAGLEAHRKEHLAYQDRLYQLCHRWAEGPEFMIAVDVHDLLHQWATEHILDCDRQYISALLDNGAK